MFFKKSFIFLITAFISLFSCDLFNSFDKTNNPVSQFYFNSNSLSVAAGFFETIPLTCNPVSEQPKLEISWSYDKEIIDIIPDNFKVIVYGKKNGSTSLTASITGFSSSCIVTVTGSPTAAVVTPYVYSNTSFVQLTPGGESVRVIASLAGGTPNDVSGFSFEAEHMGIASIVTEGNAAWLSGVSTGMTRVTVRHSKSSFPYSFIVSCADDNVTFPYITTDSNIISLNKSLTKETSFSVSIINPNPFIYDGDFSYSLLDQFYNPPADPPISFSFNGRQCVITPLKSGECFIRVTHKSSDVYYPLDILIIVYEQLDNVYIDIPEPIVYVNGSSASAFSLSLVNLPPEVYADPSDFSWIFPDNVSDYINFTVYGGGSFGTGNSLLLSGKKSGSFQISVSHPLAPLSRAFYVVVRNINTEAVDAAAYITTSQNYVLTSISSDPVTIGVTLYNFDKGEENSLLWSVVNNPKDGSFNPVIEYVSATGSYSFSFITSSSSSARSAASVHIPITSGELTINPLREGSAVISISHPKAFYETKILVSVLPSTSLVEQKPLLLFSEFSHISLLNGQSTDISVSLQGENVNASDESNITWSSSNPSLAVSSSGSLAKLTSAGSGVNKYAVTVSHPKVQMPLTITVLCGDNHDQIAEAKYVFASGYSYLIEETQTVYVSAFICNMEPGDSLVWNVASGLNSVVTVAQIDSNIISVTGLKTGHASITASIANFNDPSSSAFFQILVSSNTAPPSQTAYLSTSDNVVILDVNEQKTVTVTSVNISLDSFLSWSGYDSSLIDLIPNNESAVVRAKGKTGSTSITISHPKSANSLIINVHVGDRYVHENTDVAYISVSADTVVLKISDSNYQLYAFLAHTEIPDTSTSNFSFSISKSSIASLEYLPGQNTVFIKPVSIGQAVLMVKHPQAPDKQVLVIVERSAGDSALTPYITSKQNIVTVISGDTATVQTTLVNAQSYNNSEWHWVSSNNSSASVVAVNGSAAIIRGYNPGQATLSVSHDKAQHPLIITVLCVDSAVAASQPWISTNFSILTLKVNSSDTLTAQMIGGSGQDNSSFAFTVSDPRTLFISQSSSGAYLRGIAAGVATVSVANTRYPSSNPGNKKSVLVIVEPAAEENTFISTDKSFISIDPDSPSATLITASLTGQGASPSDNYSFSWWADDYSIVYLTSVANSASIVPAGKSGVTTIHVKHPKAAYDADIIVSVSKYSKFAFAENSKSVTKGAVSFISMQVPPQQSGFKIEYSSQNQAVCEIVGSNSTAMIAGISNGQTVVSAALKSGGQTIASAELAVIVSLLQTNGNAITVPNSIINMEIGQQLTLKALLSGQGVSEQDKFNIIWKSNDPSVASLLATENNLTKGPEAILTAKGTGETFISISHDKVRFEISSLHPQPELAEEYILVIVPQKNEKIITLNKTSVIMFKDDPDVKITASILNASQSDYSQITWSAPRVSGQNIVSIRGNGKDCNVHPLNIGTTTIRAQLPNGVYADCIVAVQSSAAITLSKNSIHLNPGYSETISYSVNPDNSQIMWNAFVNGSILPNDYFSFDVNDANKTITVTANKIGSGYIQAIMLSGGLTAKLNVFVEYNYSFELDVNNVLNFEPFPGTIIEIPYHCYPSDLNVELINNYQNYVSFYTRSHNSVTGNGVIKIEALKEKNNIILYLQASNPKDPSMTTPIRRQVTLNMIYNNITFTPHPYTSAGSFSRVTRNAQGKHQFYLGDGEDILFYLDVDQKNSDAGNISVSYQHINPKTVHNTLYTDTAPVSNENGYIRAGYDISGSVNIPDVPDNVQSLYRISHIKDILDDGSSFYLISKDLVYKNLSIKRERSNYTYEYQTSHSGSPYSVDPHYIACPTGTFNTTSRSLPLFQAKNYNDFSDPVLRDILTENYKIDANIPDGTYNNLPLYHQFGGYPIWFSNASSDDIYSHLLDYDFINKKYSGKEGSFSFTKGTSSSNSDRDIKTYSYTINYQDCTPYIISKNSFENNLNYYHKAKNIKIHNYSENTHTPIANITGSANGKLVISYTRLNETKTDYIEVFIEIRDCPSYSKNRWVESAQGWTFKQ